MACSGKRVTVGTSPVRLDDDETDGVAGRSIIVKAGSASVDIGGASVSAGAGYGLTPGDAPFSTELDVREAVYAVAASGTVVLQVFERGI